MLYEQLEQLGHRPWIICRRGFALHEHCRQAGWRHLDLFFNGSFHPRRDLLDLRAWLAWGRREHPDLIHCHRGKDHWLGCAVASRLQRPLVRTRHVVMPVHRHWFNRWLYLRATAALLCVSQATLNSFGPWARRLPNSRIILSAVNHERFDPDRRSDAWRLGLDPQPGAGEPLWYGLIGRFQSIKGQHIFLEAAARVAARVPQARFLIAGAGSDSYRLRYERQAGALGLAGRTVLLGYLENLPEALASLDVGVIASLGSEGSSRIALEMMASGLPLVATRVGGIPDVTQPAATALLVPPGNPEALAEAMLSWAGDGEGRLQTGARAREYVIRHHDPRVWIHQVLEVYAAAAARTPRPAA